MKSLCIILLVALGVFVLGGCESDSPPAAPPPDTVLLTGHLDLAAPDAKADDLWLTAVNAAGQIGAQQGLVPDTEDRAAFSLAVVAGSDFILAVRTGGPDGLDLAVLRPAGETDPRTVFTAPTAVRVDLGRITFAADGPYLVSDLGPDLAVRLPAPETDYRDLDGDLMPDAFDRDDDNDGLPDREDPVPGILLFSLDGGILMMETTHGTWRTEYWLTGRRDISAETLTLDAAAPPRMDYQTDLDYPLTLAGFRCWVDTVPAVFDRDGALTSGNFRFGGTGDVRLRTLADSDGAGSPGFRVSQAGFASVFTDTCLTCTEFACVGDDLADGHPFLVQAWTGLQAGTRMQAMTRTVMDVFAWCISHKQELTDEREVHGRDVVVNGDLFPGDLAAGTATYGWRNEDENPTINPGDSFIAVFDNYWTDRPDRTDDFRLDGIIEIKHYIDRRDLPGRVLMGANYVVVETLKMTPTRRSGSTVTADPAGDVIFNTYGQGLTDGGPAYWVEY